MNFFAVPKGEVDIRMVYNGTKNCLNKSLYAPWFPLPNAEGLICTLDDHYWCIDNDYGEMFLNFLLHPELQDISGMDFTPLYGKRKTGALWIEVWTRCPMGQSPSPFATIQQTRRLKQLILGHSRDPTNVFHWDRALANLPGSTNYRPGNPWIAKRRPDGLIAADAHDYMVDLRGCAPTQEEAWQVGSQIAKTASFYGVQDAARKRREQTQRPGAWAGVVCGTTPHRPYVSVTQTKWGKAKFEIGRLQQELHEAFSEGGDGKATHKTLEQVAGYLNHIARAFPTIRLYFKGVYASMNAWRPDRNEDGWKRGIEKIEYDSTNAPLRVRIVQRMRFDVEALEKLTESDSPPERLLRPASHGLTPRYCFGNASGAGFGFSSWSPGEDKIDVQYGTWDPSFMCSSSSNQRELGNLVFQIEEMDRQGLLNERTEIFLFTDNHHAESAFYRGTARSPEVLSLMFRLHRIVMKGYAFIHIIWVSGKRMIRQGTDSFSRSELTSGVMHGTNMLTYVPIHLTALEWQGDKIRQWLGKVLGRGDERKLHFLTYKKWFSFGTQEPNRIMVWVPPPCLADVAVYQTAEAWHVRPWGCHLLIVPSLMAGRWRKMAFKASDFLCTLPFGETL
ncbi:hypothetical protein ACA910_004905 [Epithemia clementina (nom. ined.)]